MINVTELQKKVIQAIVNIFETGKAKGNYSSVTVIKGDIGHISYGRSQVSLNSGNLAVLIQQYCDDDGIYKNVLRQYLNRLYQRDFSLDYDLQFKKSIYLAGSDPIMVKVQDDMFDNSYWKPAINIANNFGIQYILSLSILYDSLIHGSFGRIRDIVNEDKGKIGIVGEKIWFTSYVEKRKFWLGHHKNLVLRNTIYRMDELGKLIKADNWDLTLPFKIRTVELNEGMFI